MEKSIYLLISIIKVCVISVLASNDASVKNAPANVNGTAQAQNTLTVYPDLPRIGYKYESSTGHWYKFHAEVMLWGEAENTCESEETQLAIITSPAEAKLLVSLYEKHRQDIKGFYDFALPVGIYREPPGDWKTLDGQTLEQAGYSTWNSQRNAKNNTVGTRGFIDFTGTLMSFDDNFLKSPFVCKF